MRRKYGYMFYKPVQIIQTYINEGIEKIMITYYKDVITGDNGVEIYQGENYIPGSKSKSYSRQYSNLEDIPGKYLDVVEDLMNEHDLTDWNITINKSVPIPESINEAKKKPTTTKGKKKKFKKVMKEFGKGKLTPFHSNKSLKSKKQGGSKAEQKQALAIAFSESNIKKKK